MPRRRSPRVALEQIRDTLADLDRILAGKTAATYARDLVLRLAVERCIEIISEASRRVPDDLKARRPEVPWRKVAGIGNVLRHDYDEIDDAIIWHAATVEMRPLKAAVEAMLREVEADEGE